MGTIVYCKSNGKLRTYKAASIGITRCVQGFSKLQQIRMRNKFSGEDNKSISYSLSKSFRQ